MSNMLAESCPPSFLTGIGIACCPDCCSRTNISLRRLDGPFAVARAPVCHLGHLRRASGTSQKRQCKLWSGNLRSTRATQRRYAPGLSGGFVPRSGLAWTFNFQRFCVQYSQMKSFGYCFMDIAFSSKYSSSTCRRLRKVPVIGITYSSC